MNLYLKSGEEFKGKSVGANVETSGEVVFTTAMTGYLETLTDPSYYGQIVCFTFPLVGNYGAFNAKSQQTQTNSEIDTTYESPKVWVKGVLISEVSEEFSHTSAFQSFCNWMKEHNIPVLTQIPTRALTQVLREKGSVLGHIGSSAPSTIEDPLNNRYVPEVSPQEVSEIIPLNPTGKKIAFIDCGAKNGIFRNFLDRGVSMVRFPFDADPFAWAAENSTQFDGIFFSNGPGDPETLPEVIETMQKSITQDLPIFGICLGNQILALATGGKTVKMKYGHRGVNQPCQDVKTKHCIITSQNHGFVVDEKSIPADYETLFINLNDQSVEGIQHKTKPIFSIQFHPEACAGPEDAQYLFDRFVDSL